MSSQCRLRRGDHPRVMLLLLLLGLVRLLVILVLWLLLAVLLLSRGVALASLRLVVCILQLPNQSRHVSLGLRLIPFAAKACPFLGLLASSLVRRSCLELARNSGQIIRHLRLRLEEEQLEVASLVLQLHLRPIFQHVGDGTTHAKQAENLAPVRPLHHVETGHEGLLFLRCPWPTRRVDSLPPGMSR